MYAPVLQRVPAGGTRGRIGSGSEHPGTAASCNHNSCLHGLQLQDEQEGTIREPAQRQQQQMVRTLSTFHNLATCDAASAAGALQELVQDARRQPNMHKLPHGRCGRKKWLTQAERMAIDAAVIIDPALGAIIPLVPAQILLRAVGRSGTRWGRWRELH